MPSDRDGLGVLMYIEGCAIEHNEKPVRQYNENLNRLLNGLPTEHASTIIDTVNDLCWEHERRGFINGFKLGMRLEQEVSQ